jgi:hypothetical protein
MNGRMNKLGQNEWAPSVTLSESVFWSQNTIPTPPMITPVPPF